MDRFPQRKQIRLVGYDYTASGGYFITICTHQRRLLFGEIVSGAMHLSPLGDLVQQAWSEAPQHRPYIRLDAFVVMPNHVHGIVFLEDHSRAQHAAENRAQHAAPLQAGSLGALVRAFKSAVSRRAGLELGLRETIWQRNYYEHIIRSENEYIRIVDYIRANPARWMSDSLYAFVKKA